MRVVFGRVVAVFALCLVVWFMYSFHWGSLRASFNRKIQERLEQRLVIDLPSQFTVNCVVSCFPALSQTRHAIELYFSDEDFGNLLEKWGINASKARRSIETVWNGCDKASGTVQSAFVDLENRRLFFDHGTLTKGERC